ncbi:PREDICTED: fibronectin-like [Acropora digitifera]|uniref:fibronectin-like n=1 Tax=Acropora digitifera TaxID=70779 RepID=UPI00077AE9B1|nr:PREDICTED: fibronectin-like [Acropora digitifera]
MFLVLSSLVIVGYKRGNYFIYKQVIQRRESQKSSKLVYTISGNSNFAPCVFPFIFDGKTYTGCTYRGRKHNLPWCATTSNYDRDTKWGRCQTDNDVIDCMDQYDSCGDWAQRGHCVANAGFMRYKCPRSCGFCTHGGNGQGRQCSFPFFFKNRVIYDCLPYNKMMWCATTPNYNRDTRWGYCFPKLYKDLHEVNRMYFNFGECDDAHQDCGMWAREGRCADKSQEIDELCPWSCHKCAPELLVKQKECKEYSSMCKMWAERGDCFDLPIFMFAFCRWTCRWCAKSSVKPTTRDRMPRRCQTWARNGDCLTHEKFMLQNCRHSCRTGGNARDHQCHDDVAKCPDWARKGYCNDHYMKRDMKRFCQYSCGWCR